MYIYIIFFTIKWYTHIFPVQNSFLIAPSRLMYERYGGTFGSTYLQHSAHRAKQGKAANGQRQWTVKNQSTTFLFLFLCHIVLQRKQDGNNILCFFSWKVTSDWNRGHLDEDWRQSRYVSEKKESLQEYAVY